MRRPRVRRSWNLSRAIGAAMVAGATVVSGAAMVASATLVSGAAVVASATLVSGAAAVASATLVSGAVARADAVDPAEGPGAAAAACVAEIEPNDVADAVPAAGLPGCLTGRLPDGDAQDLWLWTIGDADARRLWTFTFHGVPGTLTGVVLAPIGSPPDAHPITYVGATWHLDVAPDATGPVTATDVLLPAGRYVLGVSRTTALEGQPLIDDAWRLEVRSAPLPPPGGQELRGAFEVGGELVGATETYRWTPTPDVGQWVLELRTPPGTGSALRLRDPDGTELALMTAAADGIARFSDLGPEGMVLVEPVGPGGAYVLRSFPTEEPDVDREPNGTPPTALPLGLSDTVSGRLADGDGLDLYRLGVDDTLATSLLDLRLIGRGGPPTSLCLFEESPTLLAPIRCAQATERGTALTGFHLAPGSYLVGVSGDPSPGDRYRLRVDTTSPPAADFETEPNDTPRTARRFEAGIAMRGWFDPGDLDMFRVRVGEPRGLWQVDVTGTRLDLLQLIASDGTLLAHGEVGGDGTSAVLTDLHLVPGEHWIAVRGSEDYRIELSFLGPRDAEGEIEPNDTETRAEFLAVGVTRSGRLATTTDLDVYRLSLAAAEHLRFELTPPPDGKASFPLIRDGQVVEHVDAAGVGEPIAYDAWLPGGDYQLHLHAETVSKGRYTLRVSRLDPLADVTDREPNDRVGWAAPMPASGVASGTASDPADADWYALAPVGPSGSLEIRTAGDFAYVELHDPQTGLLLTMPPEGGPLLAQGLVPGARPFLAVLAHGAYTVSVGDPAPEPVAAPPGELPLDLELHLDTPEVAGYWTSGQVVRGTLRIGPSDGPHEFAVVCATSDSRWAVDPIDDVRLEPGGAVEVPVVLRVPEDAYVGVPVAVTVGVRDKGGRQRSAMALVTPTRDGAPVEPTVAWLLPETLVGGLDAASTALAGVAMPSIDAVAEAALHDGLAYGGGPVEVGTGPLPVILTVDLAGDEPVPVVGAILQPLAGTSTFIGIPRDIALELSLDGATWQPALHGQLAPMGIEQAFALPSPVPARFARLRIDTTWGGPTGALVLGEWKVVVQPGAVVGSEPRNIADPALGGHVVRVRPQSDDPGFGAGLLTDEPFRQVLAVDDGSEATWVVGFQHDRAARVERFEWVDPVGTDTATRARRVRVAVSTQGPLGPWREIGTWRLRRSEDGSVAPLPLEDAPWARFIRFTVPAGGSGLVEMPGMLRILERTTGDDYRSIVAEWGGETPHGPLEWLAPAGPGAPIDDPDVPDDPAAAVSLDLDQEARGQVHMGRDVDWYRVSVPAGHHRIALALGGSPTVRTRLEVFDATGAPVPARRGPGAVAGTVEYRAPVEPGGTYTIRVEQAPVSAAVTFDTSGSLGPYLTWVPQALRAYARDVVGGQEWVAIRPFGESWLLPDWSDDPLTLGDAAARYTPGWDIDPQTDASSLEDSVLDSLDRLAERDGNRALLVAADAETTSFARNQRMWDALERVGPGVFTLLVGGTGTPLADRRAMQDLALAGAGPYRYARGHTEVDRAFDRLATWLRRPAGYTLSATTARETLPPPEPGRLAVVAGRRPDGSAAPLPVARDVAIGVILDTSGSMRSRIGRRSRIDVAKAVLRDLVTERLPEGVPVALRVFGSRREPCATRLAVPLGPLDADAVTRLVDPIRVDQQADTPIGQALRAMIDDLAAPAATRIVILITDSEEVWPHRDLCGLDPAAAIGGLRATGIEAQVNVVGLAVDDRRVRRQMRRWARLGGGSYSDARDREQLQRALAVAASAPFRVEDASGVVVATGTVGSSPIELPPGRYRVVVLSDPEVVFDEVVVAEGANVRLSVPP